MGRSSATPGELVFAFLMGAAAAVGVAIVTWVFVTFLGVHLLTDEAGAWSGISLGVPAALAAGGTTFYFVFRWVIRYGNSSAKDD